MIKGWRHRFSFVRAIRPLLRTILVYRPALSEVGEPDYETLSFVYRGLGYRFYKFERITSHLSIPGRIARERTQRVLLPYPAAAQGREPEGAAADFPTIVPGDLCKIDAARYVVRAVQQDNELYLTLVVEEVTIDDATQTNI